ncbi:MAG: DUF6816 family protein [Thermosynechococcaceae cyanobacterium]
MKLLILTAAFCWFSIGWGNLPLLCGNDSNADAIAAPLSDRLAQFPDWKSQPPLKPAQGNLQYPDWFLGEWEVTSTLTTLKAPLAPDIVTPGFAGQKKSLDQPVVFTVRFIREALAPKIGLASVPDEGIADSGDLTTVADQAYNSRSLMTAYLGQEAVRSVAVDPKDPTRQIMRLKGDRKLTSVISDRATESQEGEFITSELFQQIFSSARQIYVNQVENTTDYQRDGSQIEADQITAIYLSPQDPQYFKAGNQPVALYRYHLTLKTLQD